jgi:hypothetical protein
MKRPLFPLDLGPDVELSDEGRVLVWLAVILLAMAVWTRVAGWW